MARDGWAARVAEDWPAAEAAVRGGWRLGYSEGVTKRANSAVALEQDVSYEALADFYQERGTAPCVQVWHEGPEGIDAGLAARGYRTTAPTLVMSRAIGPRPDMPETVSVRARPNAAWRALWADDGADTAAADAAHRIMDRVPVMGYALAGPGAARGCVAVAGEWAGVYAMTTRAAERGRGHAGRILDGLLAWAHDKGARCAYLLVTEENAAARRAYERAGFTEASGYHYRTR